MKETLYIGDKEIKTVAEIGSGVTIKFEDGQIISLQKKLYDLIVKKEIGTGTVTDCVRAYIAKKFLLEAADYGLETQDLEGLANSIGTLAHNLREIKIGEKFGCTNSADIKLSELIS